LSLKLIHAAHDLFLVAIENLIGNREKRHRHNEEKGRTEGTTIHVRYLIFELIE